MQFHLISCWFYLFFTSNSNSVTVIETFARHIFLNLTFDVRKFRCIMLAHVCLCFYLSFLPSICHLKKALRFCLSLFFHLFSLSFFLFLSLSNYSLSLSLALSLSLSLSRSLLSLSLFLFVWLSLLFFLCLSLL